MAKRESVRGSGKDQPGAMHVTMVIHHHLKEAGETGLSLEELVAKVSPQVPEGYAWRRYVRDMQGLQRRRKAKEDVEAGRRTPLRHLVIEDTPGRRAVATRQLIRRTVTDMTKPDRLTAIRRPDKRYAVGPRIPRSMFSEEVHDVEGRRSRQHVSDMELLRIARPIVAEASARRLAGRHTMTLPQPLVSALERWIAAHEVVLPARGTNPPVKV